MIEIIDDVLYISSWEKYQNIVGLEKIREQNRIRQVRFKEKHKLLEGNVIDNVTITHDNATDIDKEIEIETDIDIEKTNYQQIADMYNEICISFPRLSKLSDARRKAIKARLNTYTVDDFKILFTLAEKSDFLKGKNDRNWSATFDWLIKDSNMAKVLDGNYKNTDKPNQSNTTNKFNQFPQRDYGDMSDLEQKLLHRG